MTRRERLERRAERRREWAESRDRKSAAGFARADSIASGIPLGQPILVGHHSEKRHRADLERIDNGMRQGVESAKMADHHRSAAAGIERQLETSIFSDDPDALEALAARLAELTAEADRMVQENKTARAEHRPAPHPSYRIQNRRNNADRIRTRIRDVRARQERAAAAEAAPGGVLIARHAEVNWCRVTFADKPARAVLDALRAAGYGWGGGSWSGYLDKLPASVAAMEGGE